MIKIREPKISDARNIAIVHIDSWLSTYRGIMPDERLDKLSYEKGEVKWINHIEQFKNDNDIILLVAEDEIRELLEKNFVVDNYIGSDRGRKYFWLQKKVDNNLSKRDKDKLDKRYSEYKKGK